MKKVVLMVAALLTAGCSVFGVRSGTEQVPYEVVARLSEQTEIRRYPQRVAAEVRWHADTGGRGEAFGTLFRYIQGANRAEQKVAMTAPVENSDTSQNIAMTAPVEATESDEGRRMRFFLPARYTMQSAPQPTDDRVELIGLSAQTVAVRRYTGSTGDREADRQQAALLDTLADSAWRPVGAPMAYYYDPPWTLPFLRRNEAAVAVERR